MKKYPEDSTMKKTIRHGLKKTLGGTARAESRRAVGQQVAKHVVAKYASKGAAKAVTRVATSPWFLAADAVEICVEHGVRGAGYDEETCKTSAKRAGFGTAALVGVAVAGPAGGAIAVGLYAVGNYLEDLW
jgi:hypothetical protein